MEHEHVHEHEGGVIGGAKVRGAVIGGARM